MDRPRIRTHVPGAFPGASGGSSPQSSASGSSSNVATNLPLSGHQDVQHLAQALHDARIHDTSSDAEAAELLTPKNTAQKKGKGRRSLGSSSATGANATEFGIVAAVVDTTGDGTADLTPRAKGKGKAKPPAVVAVTTASPAARLVAAKQTPRATAHATTSRHYVEVSSDSEATPDALVISTLKREVASLKKVGRQRSLHHVQVLTVSTRTSNSQQHNITAGTKKQSHRVR